MSLTKKWGGVYRNYLFSISLLTGAVIGAGIFSLPFVFDTTGVTLSSLYLLLILGIYILIHLMYADIIIRSDGEHRFPAYAKMYLGKSAFWIGIISTVVSSIFILTIYLVLSSSFLNLITDWGGSLEHAMIFWFLGSGAIFLGIRKLGFLEFLITSGMILVIGVIFFLGFSGAAEPLTFQIPKSVSLILLPIAPLLFALGGRSAIPSIVSHFKKRSEDRTFIRRSIILGTTVPAVIYFLFSLGVVKLSPNVSEDAVTGLIGAVPSAVLILIGILGLIAIYSSYVIIGMNVKNILRLDLNVPTFLRFLIIVGAPLLIYLSGFNQFLILVGIVGGVFGVLERILVVLMWRKANKVSARPPELLKSVSVLTVSIMFAIFLVVFIYQIVSFI